MFFDDPKVVQSILTESFHPTPMTAKVLRETFGDSFCSQFSKTIPGWRWPLWGAALEDIVADKSTGWGREKLFGTGRGESIGSYPDFGMVEVGLKKERPVLKSGGAVIKAKGGNLVLTVEPGWQNTTVSIYTPETQRGLAEKFYKETDEWISKHNFYKGQKISSTGKFLDLSAVDYEDVILPEKTRHDIFVNVKQMIERAADYDKFGIPSKRGVILAGPPGCLHADTPIYDPLDGTTQTVKERWKAGRGFHVWAMGVAGPVVTAACPPQRYPRAQMVEFSFADGRQPLRVTMAHRFWDGADWLSASEVYEHLQASEPVLLASTSDSGPSVHAEDGLHWSKTRQGSLDDYRPEFRFGDGRFHSGEAFGQEPVPSQVDALERIPAELRRGGRGQGAGHIRSCPRSVPLSKRNSPPQNNCGNQIGHQNGEERQGHSGPHGHDRDWSEADLRLDSESILFDTVPLRLDGGHRSKEGSSASCAVLQERTTDRRTYFTGSNETAQVVSAKLYGTDFYYDFHVPAYNNYWAGGVWNHNCGKTLTARILAKNLPCTFIWANIKDIHENGFEAIYEQARELAPSIVLMEDADGFGIDRRLGGMNPRLSELLNLLDGVEDNKGVITVLSSNYAEILDCALTNRPGRFDLKVFIGPPGAAEAQEIIRRNLEKRNVIFKGNPGVLATIANTLSSRGASGAHVVDVVNTAMALAVERGRGKGDRLLVEEKDLGDAAVMVGERIMQADETEKSLVETGLMKWGQWGPGWMFGQKE